jgi:protein-disulfide isomerase
MDRRTLVLIIVMLVMGTAASGAQKRYDVTIGDSPQRGPANAPVTIVEFLDYQ